MKYLKTNKNLILLLFCLCSASSPSTTLSPPSTTSERVSQENQRNGINFSIFRPSFNSSIISNERGKCYNDNNEFENAYVNCLQRMQSVNKMKLLMILKCSQLYCFAGTKYQSNLNDIDKSEQKSIVDSSNKMIDWPSKDDNSSNSSTKIMFKSMHLLIIGIALGFFTS